MKRVTPSSNLSATWWTGTWVVVSVGVPDCGLTITRAPSFLRMPDGCSLKALGGGRGDRVADRPQEDAPQSAGWWPSGGRSSRRVVAADPGSVVVRTGLRDWVRRPGLGRYRPRDVSDVCGRRSAGSVH